MRTIKLQLSESVYDHFLWFLKRFSKSEVEIIEDTFEYHETKKYLENEIKDINSGKAKFYSLEEVEAELNEKIAKYENPDKR